MPSEIHTLETNYMAIITSDLMLNTSVFYNHLSNLIKDNYIIDEETNILIPIVSNKGEMNTLGVEVSLVTNPVKNLHFDLSFVYQSTTNKQDLFIDKEVGFSPKLLYYGKAYYHLTEDISLAILGRFTEGMLSNWDPVREQRLANEVENNFVLDLNLRFNDIWNGIFLNIHANNIFDSEIRYPGSSITYNWAKNGTCGIGRGLLITAGYSF